MKSIESKLICIDKDCKLNRVITNWNDLQTHFHYQHKVYPQEKFEKKVNIKLNEFNQKFRIQIEQSISEQIANEEQLINQRIKSLFLNLKKIYFVQLKDQITINEQIESLSSNYQFESNLKKFIEIYYNQFGSPQQQQINTFLEGIKYKLNGITQEMMNLMDQVDLNYSLENQYSYNDAPKKQQEDFQYPKNIYFNQNFNQTYQNQYDYKYPQQQSNMDTNQVEEDQSNLPLRWYKNTKNQQQRSQKQVLEQSQKDYQLIQTFQFQQEQQQKPESPYILNNNDLNNDENDDRIQFQLPSETIQIKKINPFKINIINVQDLNEVQEDNQNIDSNQNKIKWKQEENNVFEENPQQQKLYSEEKLHKVNQQNEGLQNDQAFKRIYIVGKKFDITNSDKHLKYSLRFTSFSCVQQGVALVEGPFTLNENAKVKFKFSLPYEKILTASFGIQNIDNYGKKLGTYNLYMDQSGMLYKNEKPRQGSFKIELNQEYSLQYRAEKRLLCFRKQENSEYLHIEVSVSGSFKFYVKLYGLQVQIIK